MRGKKNDEDEEREGDGFFLCILYAKMKNSIRNYNA